MTNRKNRGFRKSDEKAARPTIEPKTEGQSELIRAIENYDVVFCTGPAGTGKTTISAGMACKYLLDPDINIGNILITRPTVESGGKMGYLPGKDDEKIQPYLVPILDELELYLGRQKLRDFREQGIIKICPIQYMRGRNYHNTVMILDEAQNAEYKQIKNFLTRLGQNSVAILNGDESQTDLRTNIAGGFREAIEKIHHLDFVSVIELTEDDVVRSKQVREMIKYL